MNEIKFRAKRKDNGEFVYGDLLTNNGNPIIIVHVNRDCIVRTHVSGGAHWAIDSPAYFVDPETVGQMLLKDKNEADVYEGDRVKIHFFFMELGENLGAREGEMEIEGVLTMRDYGIWIECDDDSHSGYICTIPPLHEESVELIKGE